MFSRLYLNFFRPLYYLFLVVIFILAVLPDYNSLPDIFSLSDKLNHLAAFFVLALLAFLSRFERAFRMDGYFLCAYAVGIEGIQFFLPTRFFSLGDIVADLLGIGLFLLIREFVRKRGAGRV
jgi:VanZ family protein